MGLIKDTDEDLNNKNNTKDRNLDFLKKATKLQKIHEKTYSLDFGY